MTHETATLSIYALTEAEVIKALIQQTQADGVQDEYTYTIVTTEPEITMTRRPARGDMAMRITWALLAVTWVAVLIQVVAG